VNPLAAFPQGGKAENGAQVTGSGLPLNGSPKPYTLAFTKAGVFRYHCALHDDNGMKGVIVVKA
jgi:plastocyanin